ncbi:melanocortin-2 receptor accessory protein 2A-like [Betta splendens]|uniref:Melanocortin-2 receptor accessory protein 2A-like n=1 Tax=Betta splendens TaxID=158456 RepID=A0A6P7LUD1_BETSP|nr:melanocortin-2 receptor accessory protein 2A-like [Betta splendens]
MSEFHNRSESSARRSDYVWQYEYYDDEEPVSFEGLKAHRYSIVIGFWVGLAVFVIFMFFVLTLLTKTGAPHQENPDSAEKRHRPGSRVADGPQDEHDKVFSRPLLAGSHSYFHFFVNEEDLGHGTHAAEDQRAGQDAGPQRGARGRLRCVGSPGMEDMEEDVEESGGHQPLRELAEGSTTDTECAFLSHFNIPNFVNWEHSSVLGEDDLYEPSVVLEAQAHSRKAHCDIH